MERKTHKNRDPVLFKLKERVIEKKSYFLPKLLPRVVIFGEDLGTKTEEDSRERSVGIHELQKESWNYVCSRCQGRLSCSSGTKKTISNNSAC